MTNVNTKLNKIHEHHWLLVHTYKSKSMPYDIHQENVNSKSNHKKKGQPKDKLGQSNPMCFTIEKNSEAISAELTKKCLFFFFSSFHTWGFAS